MDDRGLIERLGAWIASAFGGITLLAAVGFAARWAFREGWLGGHPEVGLAFGLMLGSLGLCLAELFWSHKQRALAAGVAGSGLGIVYFSLYAAHSWYDLLGSGITTAALLGATAVGALQAVRRDSELMAVLGFVGGMATPLLLGKHSDSYLAYLVLINAAVAAACLWRGWRVLPWLGVGGTLLFGLSWATTSYGPQGTLLAHLSAALLGAGYALLAAHPSVPRAQGVPWLVGASGGLLVALPFLGRGDDLSTAVVIPLLAVSLLASLLRLAACRHEGDVRFGLLLLVHAQSCVALLSLAGRWVLGGQADLAVALALVLVPALTSRLVGWLVDGEKLSSLLLWAASLVGATGLVSFGEVAHGWAVALAIAATGVLAGANREGLTEESGPLSGLAVLTATACLVTSEPPAQVLLTGLAIFGLATLPVLLLGRRQGTVIDYFPTLCSPALLVPLVLAWRQLTGEGWLGLVPLGLGAMSALALLWVSLGDWSEDEDERRLASSVYWALTVTFATIALPMQLQAQWLTIGLAVEGAVLLHVASRNQSGWLSGLALALLSIVTVRLVANPAVLDYHLVKTPHLASWVWYGYGLPALALAFATQVAWVPEVFGLARVRRALDIACVGVAFCGVNLLVSHGFAGGETLTLLDTGDAARALRTVSWTSLGVLLLATGGRRFSRWQRAAMGLLMLGAGSMKLVLWDLWVLDHALANALELAGVGACAFVAAGLLGRAASRPSPAATADAR